MKRRTDKRPQSLLKVRYNMCHRLRLWGIAVDTETHAIQIATEAEYIALHKTPRRYVDALRQDYGYVVQYAIMPDDQSPGQERSSRVAPAVRFRRNKKIINSSHNIITL